MMEVARTRQRSRPRKTWLNCIKVDVKNLDLFQEYREYVKKENQGGKRLTQVHVEKWAVKTVCLCDN